MLSKPKPQGDQQHELVVLKGFEASTPGAKNISNERCDGSSWTWLSL